MANPNCCIKAFRSSLLMGLRSVRWAISSADGGGAYCITQTVINNGSTKNPPAAKGIHQSETCNCNCNHLPTVLARPEAKIKLVAKKAPMISVVFLPSKKPNTNPNTIPKGSPFTNKQMIL